MNETPLITAIDQIEEVIDPQTTPVIRYRVTVQTDSGRLLLCISENGARELLANLKHILSPRK